MNNKAPRITAKVDGFRVTDPAKIKPEDKDKWLVGLQQAVDEREHRIDLLETETRKLAVDRDHKGQLIRDKDNLIQNLHKQIASRNGEIADMKRDAAAHAEME